MAIRVGIIGTGTAGMAAGLFLSRIRGGTVFSVDIFEKVVEPKAVGAGIGIQPIGMTCLSKLGLLEEVSKHAAVLTGIKTKNMNKDGSFTPVLDVEYSSFNRELFGLGLHRGVLFESLLNKCKIESSKLIGLGTQFNVWTGTEIVDIKDLDSSPKLFDKKGNKWEFDFVVIASGAHSELRSKFFNCYQYNQEYPYGAIFGLLKDPNFLVLNNLIQTHNTCHNTLGLLPTGRAWNSPENHSTMFYNIRLSDYDTWRSKGYLSWKNDLLMLMPSIEPLLDSLDFSDFQLAKYRDLTMSQFNFKTAVCIGDSAHAMSPQLGQGANLALVDAMKLAKCFEVALSRRDNSETKSDFIKRVLDTYSKERRFRVWCYQAQSRFLTPFFASSSFALHMIRDTFCYKLCHSPIFRGYIASILSGAREFPNFFKTIPPEEYLYFLNDVPAMKILDSKLKNSLNHRPYIF